MDLLRFATAGSVDDGKSTLIGRLLLDSKSIFEDQLEAVEATSRLQGLRLHRPGAADRRPALRARAGHHHRRGLPLLRDAQPQVHHRRHPGPRAVHPQHGHRRLDRRPRPGARRRPPGPDRAVPPARRDPVAAAGAAPGAARQQDGPRRLRRRRSTSGSTRSSRTFATKLNIPDLEVIPISALKGDNVVTRVGEHALVPRPDAHAPPRARPRRLRPRPGRHPLPGAVRRPPQVRRVPRLPRLRRHGRRRRAEARRRGRRAAQRHDLDDRGHRPVRQGDRRGVPADVGHRPARRRRRRLAAAT